ALPPPARWVSVVAANGTIEREALGRRRLRIGSGGDVDLMIADPHVSRLHCELEPTPVGVGLRDLRSTHGTYVGGALTREVMPQPGGVAVRGNARLFVETDAPTPELLRFGSAVSASPTMGAVFSMLEKLAASEVTVLLTGETGTGKDVLARAVHEVSPR